MTLKYDRRQILKNTCSLIAAPPLAGLIGTRAVADTTRPTANARFEQIDAQLRHAVNDKTVANIVAMGATKDGVVYEGSFGRRGQLGHAATSPDTIFWLLSMTKAVTAVACMQLVEQGKLQLDDPMGTVLPALASPKVLEGFEPSGAPKLRAAKRPVTLRHLLTHTSGYTYSIWSEQLAQYEKVTGMPDIGECKNAAFAAPLEFDPGERWQYGIGMDWVGKIVEVVSGKSLEAYFRDHIFTPLGMTDTGFLISPAQTNRVATMYNRQADGSLVPSPFEMPQPPEFFSGGAGLFSTPRNFMVFLQMLLHSGSFRGVRLLKPETVASMFRNHIGDLTVNPLKTSEPSWSNDVDLFPGMEQKWGLSFDINTAPGPAGRSAGSVTWAGLLNCYFWLDPVKHVTGAIFTQVLPFYDPGVVKIYAEFEKHLYAGTGRA